MNQADVPSLRTLPYTASIDRTLLKSIFYMGKFDTVAPNATSVEDLTKMEIKTYVKFLVTRIESTPFHPILIES